MGIWKQPLCIHYQGSAKLATQNYLCTYKSPTFLFMLFVTNSWISFFRYIYIWFVSCNFFRVFTLCSSFMLMRLVSCNSCILGHFPYSESFTVWQTMVYRVQIHSNYTFAEIWISCQILLKALLIFPPSCTYSKAAYPIKISVTYVVCNFHIVLLLDIF